MTKAELIEKIARSKDLPPDLTKKCIAQIVDTAFDELAQYFAKARVTKNNTPRFTFPGFGTFTKKKRSARRGVNPQTLEPIEIAASFSVDFKPGQEFRTALNSKRARKSGGRTTAVRAPSGRRMTARDDAEALSERQVAEGLLPDTGMARVRSGRSRRTKAG